MTTTVSLAKAKWIYNFWKISLENFRICRNPQTCPQNSQSYSVLLAVWSQVNFGKPWRLRPSLWVGETVGRLGRGKEREGGLPMFIRAILSRVFCSQTPDIYVHCMWRRFFGKNNSNLQFLRRHGFLQSNLSVVHSQSSIAEWLNRYPSIHIHNARQQSFDQAE